MYEYLNDIDFLQELDKQNVRQHFAKIILLSFDEKPIREIQGDLTAGNLSVNGSSSVRRTISLTMLANIENINIENIENEISIKSKVKVEVGLTNPLKKYDSIIWFPCGTFVLSSVNISKNTTTCTISISGKDKMCMLDGSVGGTFPASITFHEKIIERDDGTYEILQPTLYEIIIEAVNHWGGEPLENIYISDVDDTVKMLMRYMGNKPIYMSDNYAAFTYNVDSDEAKVAFPYKFTYGQDIGYEETPFTYPGELILNAGDTVVTLLDKIKNVLGNFEYFYDINGKFIFQEIKNYLNTASPLLDLQTEDYVKNYNNAKFLYSLTDTDATTAVTRAPKFDNVKNEFYVWGEHEMTSGVSEPIRYHLVIDARPQIDLAGQYMWEVKDIAGGLVSRYDFTSEDAYTTTDGRRIQALGLVNGKYTWAVDTIIEQTDTPYYSISDALAIKQPSMRPCDEWREELYRRALYAQVNGGVYDNYYDSEMIAEWRLLYDPDKEEWNDTNHWNPDVNDSPKHLRFWIDFIDDSAEIGKYSINQIGRRTKVLNNKDIKAIYNSEVPDVMFLTEWNQEQIDNYTNLGQKYFILTPEYQNLFTISTTGTSCFDKIREMLYQNLCYNTTITVTCLPKYYIEPNNIIYICDKDSGIDGNYLITQYSLPLTYNGTMSITATEVLTRV